MRVKAFLITLILVGVVVATGFWGLSQMVSTIDAILDGDAKTMQLASDLETRTLAMRRFEQDVVLDADDRSRVAAHARKWRDARAHAAGDLDALRRRSDVADEAGIVAMQKDLAVFAAGFEDVLRRIDSGAIQTSAEARAAIGVFEEEIGRVDTAAAGLAAKNVERMNGKGAMVSAAASRTRGTMGTVCIAGVFVAILIARRGRV